jgi:dTDP-glucose 4,6-dehydratase
MNVLVTGGCGFVGTSLVARLLASGDNVVNLDALTYAANPDAKNDSSLTYGDVCDAVAVESAFSMAASAGRIDVVIHMAAESHVDRSIEDPSAFLRTNVLGTQVVLAAAKRHGAARFVYVSTDEVYGSSDGGKFDEESQICPNSPYSASKAAGDMLARAYFRTYGLPVIVTRCSNNYGPFQNPEKFIPNCIMRAMEGGPIPIYGDGTNVRDWIHVDDHSAAIDLVAKSGKPGEVYNVGSSNEVQNKELAKSILFYMKSDAQMAFIRDRPGHDMRYSVNASKLRGLGWRPEVEFSQGIRETVEWYVSEKGKDWVLRASGHKAADEFRRRSYENRDEWLNDIGGKGNERERDQDGSRQQG